MRDLKQIGCVVVIGVALAGLFNFERIAEAAYRIDVWLTQRYQATFRAPYKRTASIDEPLAKRPSMVVAPEGEVD